MQITSFQIVLITQELSRPRLVRAALRDLPPEVGDRIRFVGLTPLDLKRRREEVESQCSRADALVLSHILTGEEEKSVTEVIRDHLPSSAQILAMNSLPSLVASTRLGEMHLAREIARLRKVANERTGAEGMPTGVEALMRLFADGDISEAIKQFRHGLPELLRRLPPRMGEFATYLRCCLYWNEPARENLRSLMVLLADRFGPEPGALSGFVEEPEIHPSVGLYHPRIGVFEDVSRLPGKPDAVATVGLLLMRGAVLSGDVAPADAIILEFEDRGFRVVPAFCDSFDFREAVTRYCDPLGAAAIVNATGFPLVGGHNRSDADSVREFLSARNLLYITAPNLLVQDVPSWERSSLGLSPMEVAMQVSIHELEGGIEPIVTQGTAPRDGEAVRVAITDRVDRLASRLQRWISLRAKPNREKRVLLTLFSFPPGKGSVGTAAYLDVLRSAMNILVRLKEEGYQLRLPDSPEELLSWIVTGEDTSAPIHSVDLAVGARLSIEDYERVAPSSRRVERQWGEPPGNLNTDGVDLIVHGVSLGHVFVGVQPSFGYEGDPMRLLFDKGATPHHGFLAYYRWAEEIFCADAMIHLGTHGALEFMPGKQAGLSSQCWPDILAGSLPNIYLYSVNNPSEGTIAKRRGTAVTISHLSPPVESAGLYRALLSMKGMIAEYRESADERRRNNVVASLVEACKDAHLDSDVPLPTSRDEESMRRFVGSLYVALMEIEARRIPVGLHTIGAPVMKEERIELLAAVGEHPRPDLGLSSFPHLALTAMGFDPKQVERQVREGLPEAVRCLSDLRSRWREIVTVLVRAGGQAAAARSVELVPGISTNGVEALFKTLERITDDVDRSDELSPLVLALQGGYVPPGPGGDPVRNPRVLPTGRNLHALDPSTIPTVAATKNAESVVKILLERCVRDRGEVPRTMGMVLWGLDNIKTAGEGIAQAFLLLGVRPAPNALGRMTELEIIPLAELGRPRIDVVLTVSGIFRDIFGLQMVLLDEAVRRVAELEEPEEMNFVRARRRALMERHGFSRDDATTRIFCNAPGAYGANVDYMVGMSTWRERSDLADVYLRRKGFAFGKDLEGSPRKEVLAAVAADLDLTFQNLDSSEVSIIDVDHYFEYLGGLTALAEAQSKEGRRPEVLIADTTSSRPKVRSLSETVRLEVRTKLLNPKWADGMLAHGYQGVEEIRKRFDYMFGWSATCEAVEPWIYREVHKSYIEDDAVRERMQALNLHSFTSLVERLVEADARGFWSPTPEEKQRLVDLSEEVEDRIEGVV